jgi:glycosyltransferase involved in cell wall biosynthesis
VLTNLGGWIKELRERSGAGIAVPADDAAQMAEAITWLSKNEDTRRRMGISARELAIAEFDRTKMARQFERALLESVVSAED